MYYLCLLLLSTFFMHDLQLCWTDVEHLFFLKFGLNVFVSFTKRITSLFHVFVCIVLTFISFFFKFCCATKFLTMVPYLPVSWICDLIPAVQMWQEEWGAQAIPFTQALWLLSLATGVQGTRTSNMMTYKVHIIKGWNNLIERYRRKIFVMNFASYCCFSLYFVKHIQNYYK